MAIAVHTIKLSDFSQTVVDVVDGDQREVGIQDDPLPDGDHIWLSVEPSDVGANGIEIALSSAAQVTWYKEIKAFDSNNHALSWVATHDAVHGPVSMKIADVTQIANLVFTKAKLFGIHTGMYTVTDGLFGHRGSKLAFNWTRD